MPSSQQKTTEPKAAEATVPSKSEVPAQPAEGDVQLPEGVSERTTEQFDKLKAQNQELKQQLESQKGSPDEPILGAVQQPTTPLPEPQSVVDSFYNAETGEVDIQALRSFEQDLVKTKQELGSLKQTFQNERDAVQEEAAYEAHPDLKTNKDLRRKARAVYVDSMINPQDYGNKIISLKEATDLVKTSSDKAVEAAEKAGAQQALESLTPKEQAALEATGRSDKRQLTAEELEDLRRRTREGDPEAIMQRLKGIPFA
jgi:DNA repair exonuclease SbcCD ATPase subunit